MNLKSINRSGFQFLACFMMPVLLCSCLEMKDKLKINHNGSATWEYEIKTGPRLTAMLEAEKDEEPNDQIRISSPTDNAVFDEAKMKNALKSVKGAKLIRFDKKKVGDSLLITAKIEFSSIHELVKSELAKQVKWNFIEKKGRLLAYTKDLMDVSTSNSSNQQEPKFNMVKAMFMGMAIERTIELPNTIVKTNSKKTSGKQAQWSFKLTGKTTEKEFDAFNKLKPYAYCSLSDVSFKLPVIAIAKKQDAFKTSSKPISDKEMSQLNKDFSFSAKDATLSRRVDYVNQSASSNNGSLNFNFTIKWNPASHPAGYRNVIVTKATDDKGNDISKEQYYGSGIQKFNASERSPNQAKLYMNLKAPSKQSTSYDVEGRVTIVLPSQIQKCEVKDLQNYVGKKLEIPELKAFDLTLKSMDKTKVEFNSPVDTSKILEVKLVSADQTAEAKPWHVNNMKWGNKYLLSASFHKIKFDNPVLVITYAKELKETDVPFKFDNLKTP